MHLSPNHQKVWHGAFPIQVRIEHCRRWARLSVPLCADAGSDGGRGGLRSPTSLRTNDSSRGPWMRGFGRPAGPAVAAEPGKGFGPEGCGWAEQTRQHRNTSPTLPCPSAMLAPDGELKPRSVGFWIIRLTVKFFWGAFTYIFRAAV